MISIGIEKEFNVEYNTMYGWIIERLFMSNVQSSINFYHTNNKVDQDIETKHNFP